MGMTPGSNGMNFLKGGLTGLSQGLANYNNPHPVYDFSGLAQGFQDARDARQPKVVDLSASLNQPSKISKPDPTPNLQLVADPNAWAKLGPLFTPPKSRVVLGSNDPNQDLDHYYDQAP
jgi:hypothetical protein